MSWWSRLVRTIRPERHDAEIEEELAYHLAMHEQDGVDSRAARIRLGNPSRVREETRAQGMLTWLESLVRDVRYGLRQLRKTRTVTLVVVLILALGIGATSAIFSLVEVALLKPLPVKDPQSLILLNWTNHGWPEALCTSLTGDFNGDPTGQMQGSSIAPRIYRRLAKLQSGFSSLIGFSDVYTAGVAVRGRPAEQLSLQYVSADFFSGLGVSPRLGRSFSTADDRVGQAVLVIISERFWQKAFGGRGDVLGQTVRVNNVPVEIIGVAPAGFFGVKIGEWEDMWAPLAAQVPLNPRVRLDRSLGETDGYWWVRMLARRKPAVSEGQAMQQLSAVFQRLVVPGGLHVDSAKIPKLVASPGSRGFDPVGKDETRALWIVLLLVSLILLIVCANVANLLLSRAVARQRESAVCLALGAGRIRLFRKYSIESFTLAASGGIAGLFLSDLLVHAIEYFVRAELDIGDFDLHIDPHVLLFTLLVSLLTALLFGLAPTWQLSRANIHDALKATTRNIAVGRQTLPRILVAIQIGLSFTVLIAAGLLNRSLTNLKAVNIGFERGNLVYASVHPWNAGYKPEQVSQYVDRLRARLAAIPGVSRVALIQERPLSGNGNMTTVNIAGQAYRQDGTHTVMINEVSDGLFETLGIPLVAGRRFEPADMQPKSEAVIVDQLFVEHFYPHQDPLGRQFGTGPHPTEIYRIVGVVKNSRYNTLRKASEPTMFLPLSVASEPGSAVHFVMRAAIDAKQLAGAIRKIAAGIDPSVPVVEIETQTALIDHLLLFERLLTFLADVFGALALTLSAIGLIGLLAYTVARRTSEIGVRIALGASKGDVIQLILKDAMSMFLVGIAFGLPGAFFVGQLLKRTLFNLPVADPITAVFSLVILAAIAAVSSFVPAWRAARIDPMTALREE